MNRAARERRQKNPDKYREMHRRINRRECTEIADVYLRRKMGLNKDQVPAYVLDLKRAHLKLVRKIREAKV
jgi:5-methylcytosine-specific restriction endonuclease McrA